MKISSPVFSQGDIIPKPYTCYGQGINPALQISGVPTGAQSLAIYMHDPDSSNGNFVHWTIWNISAATTTILANHIPSGASQGVNDFGNIGWGAPCPNKGTHRYVFEIYALNRQLNLPAGSKSIELLKSLQPHIMAKAELIGTVAAQ
jgi:Raf kinase inhibitor-like YbhB/YbcL family protein